jgi:hypothetical protein
MPGSRPPAGPFVYQLLVGACMLMADPAKGRPVMRESVALARKAGDYWCLTASLAMYGLIWRAGQTVGGRAR